MKYVQLILCYLNLLSAMSFSLIAPLLPPLCKEKGISNQICSYIISSLCFTQILTALYCPNLIQKYGQKRLFLISVIGQTVCTFFYGFMAFIYNNSLFIFTGFLARLLHGFFTSVVNIISFSMTALINKGKELERAMGYMELSWGIGLAVGPAVIGIFFDIGGYFLPFILIGTIYSSGVYFFYQIPNEDFGEGDSNQGSINSIELNNEKDNPKKNNMNNFLFLYIMFYPQAMILMGCLMIELNTTDFYIPTLVNYLKESFSIETSKASLFFLASTFGYIICTQVINQLTDLFNNFKLIFIGHILGFICCLLTAPIGFLPHNYIFIIIGIFIQGFVAGMINIPGFVELNNFGKKLFPHDSHLQRDIPSSLFNFSFFFGDLVEPILGSWINAHFNFQISAYFAAFLSILMAVIFYYYYFNEIKETPKNEINIQLINKEMSNINKMSD